MNKNKQKIIFKEQNIDHSFTGTKLTKYAGLSVIMKFLNKEKLGKQLDEIFPSEKYSATKFSNTQIIISIILASLSGINRAVRISNFTSDSLVLLLLNLRKNLNKDVIGQRLKRIGQKGSILFQEYTFKKVREWVWISKIKEITIDCDSTVHTVYGNQEGASKGYNTEKKGAKSYHSLLAFLSEIKLVINNRFRTGSSYTSNGILSFVEQTSEILPEQIEGVFFRADSGFFNGELFDLLEEKGWQYLVKVKLKNMKELMIKQQWKEVEDGISISEFDYKSKGWKKIRKLKAIRSVKGYIEVDYFGEKRLVAVYEYSCFCSNLSLDAFRLYENYKQRSTSENWIEQVKNQLLASKTLTNNFHANDLLWQFGVFAYNLSVIMRYKAKKHLTAVRQVWREEHNSFRDWFIELPAKIVRSGRQVELKIYENYYFRKKWEGFQSLLLA